MNKDLVVNYILSEVNDEEKRLVEAWIEQDPKHKKEYLEMKKIWEISTDGDQEMPEVDVDRGWSDFLMLKADREAASNKKNKIRKFAVWQVAASISIVSLLSFWLLFQANSVHIELVSNDAYKQTELPDGSIVNLNKNAGLSYDTKWLIKERKVALKHGEVFFDVKRDENKPFIISSGNSIITVLGTSFHVRRENTETEVVVTSGSVKVNYADQEVILKPSQSITIQDSTKMLVKLDTVPDQLYRYYVHQEFIFENTPLKRVFEVLGKAYNQKFVIEKADNGKLLYTATFQQQSLNEMIQVILATFDLKLEKKGNTHYIK